MIDTFKRSMTLFLFALMVAPAAMAEEAATAGHEAAEAHSAGLPQFDPTSWPSQIFWLAVFFVVLYTAYARVILPAISGTIENRTQYIAGEMAAAEAFSKEAAKLQAEVNAGLKTAGQTAATLVQTAEASAKENLSGAITQFRARFESEMALTETRMTEATADVMKDMQTIAATLAAQAATKIAGISTSATEAEAIVASLNTKTRKAA